MTDVELLEQRNFQSLALSLLHGMVELVINELVSKERAKEIVEKLLTKLVV
jgi:hypothetical protein